MKNNRLIMHDIIWVHPISERKKTTMPSLICRFLTYNGNSDSFFLYYCDQGSILLSVLVDIGLVILSSYLMVTFKKDPAVWDDEVTSLGQGDSALRNCSALQCSKVLTAVEPSHWCGFSFSAVTLAAITWLPVIPSLSPEGFSESRVCLGRG